MTFWLAQSMGEMTPEQREAFWREVSRHVGDGGDSFANTELFFAALALLMFAVALAWFTRWHQHRKLRSKPLMTFHRVANGLQLSLKDQWLLAHVARNQSLPNPMTLLVCPTTFDHHAEAFVSPLSGRRQARVRRRLASVHRAIFEG